MTPFVTLTASTVVLPRSDVDTDQIIPARFLTTTTREGLGKALFADWRFLDDGAPNPDFVLNRPEHAEAKVLVAGRNFGCGSSREHAPWALLDYGFRAIVSSEIADIFHSNALKNGLLPVRVPDAFLQQLMRGPRDVHISVSDRTISILEDGKPAEAVEFPLDGFARYCLLEGIDQLGYLLAQRETIDAHESAVAEQLYPPL